MSTLPLPHLQQIDLELSPPPPPPPPPPHRHSTDSGATASSCSSSAEVELRSWHSPTDSSGGTEIVGVSNNKRRESSVSECSVVDLVDLEAGVVDKAHYAASKEERDCRICHLSLDVTNDESAGIPIELGCSCKDDLAAAHKHCAEAWFKIKGNKTCEICGSTARNVAGANEAELMEQWNEANDTAPPTAAVPGGTTSETRNFWQGHRFLNFLLACMVFAFVISWLFHFNVPS